MDPKINPDVHTPLPSNKKDSIQHEQSQITISLETQMLVIYS